MCRYNEGMNWHCRSCGNCSTAQDLEVYKNTSNTIMELMKNCIIYGVSGGNIEKCIDDNIGFTVTCNQCIEVDYHRFTVIAIGLERM